MKRILIVGDFKKGSGLTNYIMNTYHFFSPKEFKIDCLSYAGTNELASDIKENGWGFYSVIPVTKNPIKHWGQWRSFLKTNGYKYDIVHFNYSATWNFYAVLNAKKFGIKKVIIHSHNNYYSKNPKNYFLKQTLNILNNIGKRVIARQSDLNLAVSNEAARWMFEDQEKVYIQKNGIRLGRFEFSTKSRHSLRKQLKITDKTKAIGFVGTLEERKNPLFALELMRDSLFKNKETTLLIFGDGPDKRELMRKAVALGIEEHVFFMGIRANLNEWYSAMDAFIFPSKTEGFGFALLEAQANGLLAFCSDSIPHDVMLTNSVYPISLKEKATWLQNLIDVPVTNVNKRKKESVKNCHTIQENGYAIESTSKELRELIEHCVNGDKYFG